MVNNQSSGHYLKMSDIENGIRSLSYSQGFYGRLNNDLQDMKKNDKESYNQVKKQWESKKYKDFVDFIIDLES